MKKIRLQMAMLVITAMLLPGCSNKQSTARDFLDETIEMSEENSIGETVIETVTETINSEDITSESKITMDYLKNRYPGKTILTYAYQELYDWEESGAIRYSDKQMVALNDYLVENNQDYVLYFMPIAYEDMTLEYMKQLVHSDNPPDIITSANTSGSIDVDNTTFGMISENLFLELDKYSENNFYKSYVNSLPQAVYDLSLYNNKFYGFKTQTFYNYKNYYVYDKDLAEKYGIEKDDLERKSLREIMPILEKVKQGEKDTKDFIVSYPWTFCYDYFINPNIYFDGYKKRPYENKEINGLACIGYDVEGGKDEIISVADSEVVKDYVKTTYEFRKKEYDKILNNSGDNDYDFLSAGMSEVASLFLYCNKLSVLENPDLKDVSESFVKLKNSDSALAYEYPVHGLDFNTMVINGVCSKSKYPEKAIEALSFIYNSEVASGIMYEGPESVGYEVKNFDGNTRESVKDNIKLTNRYLIKDANQEEDGETIKKTLENAKVVKEIEGYYFDLSEYKDEVVALREVENEFMTDWKTAIFDEKYSSFEDAWSDFDRKLKEAGIENLLEGINKQYKELREGK